LTDAFRLVRRDRPLEPAEARQRLNDRQVAGDLTKHGAAAPHYKLDDDLETAINMALAVGAPLLVTGEPGTGKTQLAYFLGNYFSIKVRPFHVKSTSNARDLKYDFDAVGYLQSAYAAREGAEKRERSAFLTEGPLWQAYEDKQPSVLLIDEIDKAPRDFPNDLLHELDQGWFPHPFKPELRIPGETRKPPIVIITSNVERRLPGPFLRRTVFHHIELTETLVRHAVAARAGEFPNVSSELRQIAVERFWDLREHDLQKPPSTAELLVWLAILNARGVENGELRRPLGELPALGSLVKDKEDLDRLR
jgi:MoxR-like ATPase